jgi:hypothetical protein
VISIPWDQPVGISDDGTLVNGSEMFNDIFLTVL